jgi:hypothetical protein
VKERRYEISVGTLTLNCNSGKLNVNSLKGIVRNLTGRAISNVKAEQLAEQIHSADEFVEAIKQVDSG